MSKAASKGLRVLTIDVGGTNVKVQLGAVQQGAEGEPLKIPSGPSLTPARMLEALEAATAGWEYDVVSVGYPGLVVRNRPLVDPANLGPGWEGFDFERAFGRPVRVLNDAALQALGSYRGGVLLFLGLGTGLGACVIDHGRIEPMELAHLPYKKGRSFEEYLGKAGRKDQGARKWERRVFDVVARLSAALDADDVVLGGGNAKKLESLPPGARLGSNAHAFIGGVRLWEERPPQRPEKT